MAEKNKDIGIRLIQYRKKKNLKAIDLAKILKISQGTLSDIENNKTFPSGETLSKLVRHTDMNISWLFTGKGPMLSSGEVSEATKEKIKSEDLKITRPLNTQNIPKRGKMSVFHFENFTAEKIKAILSTEVDLEEVKKMLDFALDYATQDERGWLKIELTNLLYRFFNLIKRK